MRICDLGVRLDGSELQPRVEQLYQELATAGVRLRPLCYLGSEWFTPTGFSSIAIPFYLAHPRLKELEMNQMLEVEGGDPEWCMQLLRHECGHAVDHAYGISNREDWRAVFGNREEDYEPESYTPRPYSKRFVRHLPNWYAQAHPDEDFAETFAVWLSSPPEVWREQYRGWQALKKLEFVNGLMEESQSANPVRRSRRMSEAKTLRRTLRRYYAERRELYAEAFLDFYDADLQAIFSPGGSRNGTPGAVHPTLSPNVGEPAAKVLKRQQKALVRSVVQWTGQRKYTVNALVGQFIQRCRTLKLHLPAEPEAASRVQFELGAYMAALVTNHLYTGKFKRST